MRSLIITREILCVTQSLEVEKADACHKKYSIFRNQTDCPMVFNMQISFAASLIWRNEWNRAIVVVRSGLSEFHLTVHRCTLLIHKENKMRGKKSSLIPKQICWCTFGCLTRSALTRKIHIQDSFWEKRCCEAFTHCFMNVAKYLHYWTASHMCSSYCQDLNMLAHTLSSFQSVKPSGTAEVHISLYHQTEY